jgi:hypothetical protein
MLQSGFVSDGSALHEWVYGKARLKVGLNPNDKGFQRFMSRIRLLPYTIPMAEFIGGYEKLVKAHTAKSYDLFIHLPIEFPIVQDGHRPVNEQFRRLSNDYLLTTIRELGIPYIETGGSVAERITKIVAHLNVPLVMPVEEAVSLAQEETKRRNSLEMEYGDKLKKQRYGSL